MATIAPSLNIPPELKKITQYIRRAEELDRDKIFPESRLVAYYLRQYAVQIGIPLVSIAVSGGDGAKKCLGEILSNLEGEKKAMNNFSKEESQMLCRAFADRILEKADQQDMAVSESIRLTANPSLDLTMQQLLKDTAQAFYAAGTFYDILQQFYDSNNNAEMDQNREEENKRRLYCKFKATEILKALKEGRFPTSHSLHETSQVHEEPIIQSLKQERGHNEDISNIPPKFIPSPSLPLTDDWDLPVVPKKTEVSPSATIADSTPWIPVPLTVPTPVVATPHTSTATVPTWSSRSDDTPPIYAGTNATASKGKTVSKTQFSDARELVQFALSAIDAKDADLATERLRNAIESLGRR